MALKQFITHIKEFHINSPLSKEEMVDIENGVSKFITELTHEVGMIEPLFEMKRIIKAGSFYEGTKNGRPDEFDFLVELDKKFTADPGCQSNACSAHVKVPQGIELSAKRKYFVLSGYLLSAPTFTHYWKAIEQVLQAALFGQNNLNNFQCKNGHLTIFTSMSGSGPNTEIHLVWHRDTEQSKKEPFSYGISIDVSPCIPCPDNILMAWKDHLQSIDFQSKDRQTLRPVLVIPSPKHCHSCQLSRYRNAEQQPDHACWKISYAPAEVHMMKQLSENHNLCYRFLKYVCKGKGGPCTSTGPNDSLKTLSSFMLKNAILQHAETCNDGGTQDMSWCLKSVLKYINSCADKRFLPAYFFPKRNLWASKPTGNPRPPIRILQRLSDYLFKDLEENSEDNVTDKSLLSGMMMMQEEFMRFEFEDYRMDQ